MADGCRLAARLWRPHAAAPVPAILEYLPYRFRDGTVVRDGAMHAYLAAHGYACVRVDIRGSGDSDGVLIDEYLKQEQDDALEAIAWIARQSWCDGRVGMMGISWGGFNALQVAARRPPALRAIVSVAAVVDRYRDDTHYAGGCLLSGNLGWGATFLAMSTRPPDPLAVGARWRDLWRARLEGVAHPAIEWMKHPDRDAYWRHGSVAEDYSAIQVPVLAVSGWEDAYTNAVFHLLANLRVPCRGLIGPWAHAYPHLAHLDPIDFLGEVVRWFDHWMKDRDNGVMAEPALRYWLQDGVRPASFYRTRPGRWIGEPTWPSATVVSTRFPLAPGRLGAAAVADLPIRSPTTVGVAAGVWCPYGFGAEMPTDQREEDGGSLCFDGEPLPAPCDVVGFPVVDLEVALDRAAAIVCARLCEVFPDGASTRVSYGLFDLTRHAGDNASTPLEPGRRYRVTIPLKAVGHRFLAGNRIRLALSTGYWPMVWPAPAPTVATIHTAGCAVVLPIRSAAADLPTLRPFDTPRTALPLPPPPAVVDPGDRSTLIERDLASDRQAVVIHKDRGRLRFADGLETHLAGVERYTIGRDPATAEQRAAWRMVASRGHWSARAETETAITGTATTFEIVADLRAYDGNELFHTRTWRLSLPRRPG
ncbi:MAG: CocE/NonD family hydrolase [Alphaproteobacteria bacterium]|nr:CocE/NonD family hydrolase [Alphaproteobacteria bacterium]